MESALYRDDVSPQDPYPVFSDEKYTDVNFYGEHPTIHHLLTELMTDCKPHDIRLVYIACAWLVAHRGHFLSEVDRDNVENVCDFNAVYDELMDHFTQNGMNKPWQCGALDFAGVMQQKEGVTQKEKDTDARWTKKGDETHYGYKNHAKVDADSKIITDYSVTDASVHDSNEFADFVDDNDKVVYADSAYVGKELPGSISVQVCEKGYRNRPLTDEQKQSNRRKAKVRCRIEHVFGFMTNSMNGITIRSIGMQRASFNIGLTNLIYNFCRYSQLKRKEAAMG